MSDLRVNTRALERTYLVPPADELWNVTPVWEGKTKGNRRFVLPDSADGEILRVVQGVIRVFEAKTMAQHREAVDIFSHDFLWDGPPIRLSNKGHLRLATYLFKFFAHLSIIPVSASVSEPTPGKHLIELDAVAVSRPHRVWWIPATLLLPSEVPKNIHFKIGVNGSLNSGHVEFFTGRLTNFPPFVPLFLRNVNGILMGALPHAFENVLGFGFDLIEGGNYYQKKRDAAFQSRHPHSSNYYVDFAQDLIKDIPQWAKEHGQVLFETVQATAEDTFPPLGGLVKGVFGFYAWAFNTGLSVAMKAVHTATDVLSGLGNGGGHTSSTAGYAGYTSGTPGVGVQGGAMPVSGKAYIRGSPGRPVGTASTVAGGVY
jgi:hypothetical protein